MALIVVAVKARNPSMDMIEIPKSTISVWHLCGRGDDAVARRKSLGVKVLASDKIR